ncbi:molybdopterin molybdotransferase MoeA [Skermanella rosea]|uniref:molybdopterin molybdotransferase MoeA n=1 Tax=Skermanella rosea TaxID=1817965 RepID=UPI0019341170|nr:gephyrin-like molybdotransferase Glp [Skermanella rosea]UEM05777.1 molybdopterin molybdotransferase MoeA [Skermanella rosea]
MPDTHFPLPLPAPCCGGDHRLLPVASLGALLDRVEIPGAGAETVGLGDAVGRVLAEDIVATGDLPSRDCSAMDGYAVAFDGLEPGRPSTLPVVGRVAAGHPLDRPVRRGEAVRIFTGAALPDGCDTVVMQEHCAAAEGFVTLPPAVARNANRRRRGEDVSAGTLCLARGAVLRPQDIGMAAALGHAALRVRAPVRVAVFSTGDELCEPGEPLGDGRIHDINRYTLTAMLKRLGCAVTDLGIVRDDRRSVVGTLAEAACGHDLIVTSGGMSVGEEDHVKAAVGELGSLGFWRLAVKPGKPVAVGHVGAVPFVGLPGNPVAVMVTFALVARPLIRRIAGAAAAEPRRWQVAADFAHDKPAGRRDYLRGRLLDGGRVAKFRHDGSHVISSMVEADGLIELRDGTTRIEPGDRVDFLPFAELL